jgi:NAD(P)-dependent dehydrogenase (short-subunit alcohol dehydrogenase family)
MRPTNLPHARTALVTGGGRGAGRAIALALAAKGWNIAVQYYRAHEAASATVAEIEASGRRAHAFAFDFQAEPTRVHGEPQALLKKCSDKLGPVTCVVHAACMARPETEPGFSLASLGAHTRRNVAAPLSLAHALWARLPLDAHGVIVTLLDRAHGIGDRDFLGCVVSNGSLETATRMIARSLAPRLRAVAVAHGSLRGQQELDDLAQAVVFTVHATAVTGATLLVDGGDHLVPSAPKVSKRLTPHSPSRR